MNIDSLPKADIDSKNMDFFPKTDIDRRQCKRVVPMRCLMLGLGRTGTNCALPLPWGRNAKLTTSTAIREALKILGFDETYHMVNASQNPKDNELWMDALKAKTQEGKHFGREQWDQLLGHCQVASWWASSFCEMLILPRGRYRLPGRSVRA